MQPLFQIFAPLFLNEFLLIKNTENILTISDKKGIIVSNDTVLEKR